MLRYSSILETALRQLPCMIQELASPRWEIKNSEFVMTWALCYFILRISLAHFHCCLLFPCCNNFRGGQMLTVVLLSYTIHLSRWTLFLNFYFFPFFDIRNLIRMSRLTSSRPVMFGTVQWFELSTSWICALIHAGNFYYF